jgi:hypothetical protein
VPHQSGKLSRKIRSLSSGRFIGKHDFDWAYQIAQVYAFRGESDKSFEWLERAYKQRDPGLPSIKVDPL